jgi:hypothetical protein
LTPVGTLPYPTSLAELRNLSLSQKKQQQKQKQKQKTQKKIREQEKKGDNKKNSRSQPQCLRPPVRDPERK